jgi:hypothetical protein
MDPTASHLIITTAMAENYYLHSQSKTPKNLSRLKGVAITSVAWSPSQPTASTREILIGSADGNIYETFIDPQPDFYRREEKYVKNIFKSKDGPIEGLWVDKVEQNGARRVLVATPGKLMHWAGKVGQVSHEGSGSIYTRLFEAEIPDVHTAKESGKVSSILAISPELQESEIGDEGVRRAFAWLSPEGIFHGNLPSSDEGISSGSKIFAEAKTLSFPEIPAATSPSGRLKSTQTPNSMVLSRWHIIQLVGGRIIAMNQLDDTVVLDQKVLEPGQTSLGLFVDSKKETFWLVTSDELFEIRAEDETRDVWKILLKTQQFDAASRFATTAEQKDAVATASGDYLVGMKQYMEAATVYGRSTKPFEQVALTFIDNGESDALRKYLLTKMSSLKKGAKMQHIMIATWLVELFMAKLNILDDTITAKVEELSEGQGPGQSNDQLTTIRREFQDFCNKNKNVLDVKSTYEVISSHGREEELLYFAGVANDYNFVLAYWIQRDRWDKSLEVLKKQTDPEIFYKYSSVLMANAPEEFVDILMRQYNIDPRRLIPAILNYHKLITSSSTQTTNQAIRYLNYVINTVGSTDPSIHNTLISILASSPTDETALLSYLRSQSLLTEPCYDADFALRLCIQHSRVQSCVHIYTSMGQFPRAVDLALKHNEVDLASQVADQATTDRALKKRLWLKIAKQVIANSSGNIKTAIDFLNRCDLLKIEDLIPFFPDFVIIDDFKDEICQALEEYSRSIDALKREMDDAALTASNIKAEIKGLDQRYAIVEPGERCWICRLPLLVKQFFVFPCQHAFHSECLGTKVVELAGAAKGRKIRELQAVVQRSQGKAREEKIKELDGAVASGW